MSRTMNKAPAFQWYPQDALSSIDCQLMTLEEYGAYHRLLDLAWVNTPQCYLPNHGSTLAQLLRISDEHFQKIWKTISKKFQLSDDMIFNPRQLEEYKKQCKYRQQQSLRGKLSAQRRLNQRSTGPVEPEGNSSSSSSISTIVPKGTIGRKRPKTPTPEIFEITDKLSEWASKCARDVDLKKQTDRFLDYHRAKGSIHADWSAAWREWMRRAQDPPWGSAQSVVKVIDPGRHTTTTTGVDADELKRLKQLDRTDPAMAEVLRRKIGGGEHAKK